MLVSSPHPVDGLAAAVTQQALERQVAADRWPGPASAAASCRPPSEGGQKAPGPAAPPGSEGRRVRTISLAPAPERARAGPSPRSSRPGAQRGLGMLGCSPPMGERPQEPQCQLSPWGHAGPWGARDALRLAFEDWDLKPFRICLSFSRSSW